MTTNNRKLMVFGDGKANNGTDGWFWPDLTGQGPEDEPNTFPLVLQMGVWRGELTVEQARELRDLRGFRWWNNIDFRVIRKYLAEQEGKAPPAEPAPRAKQSKQALAARQADELIASLRQATAALLEADKAFDPSQPRYPAGDERGGQWRPEGGAGETQVAANAQLDITTGDINAMRADMGLPPVPTPEPEAGRRTRTSTSRKIKDVGTGINATVLLEDESGTRWVWKPVGDAQDNNSEVAAYEIAQVLGMDCVPPTRYETFDGELGTAQQFVDGTLGTEWTAEYGSQTVLDILPRGTEDAVVLDFIIDNDDRHTANWIVGEGRKVWAIDNGGANWTSNEGNESSELYWNTLVNYWLARKPGKLRISPEKLERWSSITKEEFLGAFRDVPKYGETKVNPENAWSNLQSITKSGVVAWREWDGPSALSLPDVGGESADPPMNEDDLGESGQAQRAPWPLFERAQLRRTP